MIRAPDHERLQRLRASKDAAQLGSNRGRSQKRLRQIDSPAPRRRYRAHIGGLFDLPFARSTTIQTWQHCTVVHDPSARDDFEALRVIGALDDLGDQKRQNLLLRRPEFWSLVTAVGEKLAQKRVQSEQCRQHQFATIAILNIGGMHNRVQQ